ncbi:ethanolamine phosphate phosphodiesterase, partial [Tremellales sp. Uapishka_1]
MQYSPKLRSPPLNAHGIANGVMGRGRKSGLRSRTTQVLALRFGWVVLIIWFEAGEVSVSVPRRRLVIPAYTYQFFHSLSTCHFPDSGLRQSTSSFSQTAPTHVVLLSDPHIPHRRLSYPQDSRPWANFLKQGMDELFMRKSWNVVMRLGRVDAVIVLGDMLDWGRGVMSDQEYEEYYSLFHSIFSLPSSTPMYFVPGNHDIPLGSNRHFSPRARDRYARHFSPPNAILPIANHSLILLDAVGLVEEDYRRYAAEMQFGEWDGVEGGVIEFIKGLGDEASTCGPLREKGRILKGAGIGYQNLLGSETSRFLLNVLKPSVVFSGDDHDYCEHKHPSGIKEITVKSFSSSTGIRRPGFQLLSLIPPSNNEAFPPQLTHADVPCFLPDQLGVYNRVYLPLAILTVLYLVFTNSRAAWTRLRSNSSTTHDPKGRSSPNLSGSDSMAHTAMASSRRVSERPTPLTLPSRKSSQHLTSLNSLSTNGGSQIPRSARSINGAPSPYMTPSRRASQSAPVSPLSSPRMSMSETPEDYLRGSQLGRMDEDLEAGVSLSPNISRRSSYVYTYPPEHLSTPQASTNDASSYFLPLPNSGPTGLGLSSPNGGLPIPNHPLRRVSSSNLLAGVASNPARRVTMPRMLSTSDWSAAAKAKDKSVLGLMVDSLPGASHRPRHGPWLNMEYAGRSLKWLWKARNGVIIKSWREVVAVAWPAGLVWLLVNALFFFS